MGYLGVEVIYFMEKGRYSSQPEDSIEDYGRPFWREKIGRALLEANLRGEISRKIARKWLKYYF